MNSVSGVFLFFSFGQKVGMGALPSHALGNVLFVALSKKKDEKGAALEGNKLVFSILSLFAVAPHVVFSEIYFVSHVGLCTVFSGVCILFCGGVWLLLFC